MSKSAIDGYHELIGRVDVFIHDSLSVFGGRISCRPGCDMCCGKSFSVFAIEAANMRSCFGSLPEESKSTIRENLNSPGTGTCPLLHDGLCLVYDCRPVICRTHGMPLVSEHIRIGGKNVTSLCEKNSGAIEGPGELPMEHVLDLDRLNSVLSVLNMLYLKETGKDAPERVKLEDVFSGM